MFTQIRGTNVYCCNGCRYQCSYGAKAHIDYTPQKMITTYMPTLNGQKITTYIERGGHVIDVKRCDTAAAALELAVHISELCDRYKTR